MKHKWIAYLTASLLVFGIGEGVLPPSPKVEAAVGSWQKAMTIDPRWTTDFASDTFKESVRKIKAANVSMLTLIIPLYQSNIYSTDIGPGWNTPTDESLVAGIEFARSLGLQVSLKIHMVSYDGQWRAHINPSDRGRWFRNYGDWVERYARISQAEGVEMLAVGSELIDMATVDTNPTNTQNWKELIARVRSAYSGKLTYSANWGGSWWADEKNRIEFWSDLDYIGIAAYFVLNSEPNKEALQGQWDYWRTADIEPLKNRWGKPVLFTEIGYRSMSGARFQPFNSWDHWGVNEWEQAQLYEALFQYWNNYSWMQGVHLWDWISDPNAGGPGDDGYTPQGKMAEGVMRTWFGSTVPVPNPENPSFSSATATAAPGNPVVGQATVISARVTAGNGSSSRIIVDVEVENSVGTKVFQQYFEDQSFTANEARTYVVNWIPMASGVHKVRIGVFNSTWGTNYLWVGDAGTVNVASSASPPTTTSTPPAPSSVQIWWPTSGSTISGLQPFKAMLENRNVNDYDMFWQVDGDRLNAMPTSLEDYPHKEAWADVLGWTWKGSDPYYGPYALNFIAKDRAGNVLGEKQSMVNVVR